MLIILNSEEPSSGIAFETTREDLKEKVKMRSGRLNVEFTPSLAEIEYTWFYQRPGQGCRFNPLQTVCHLKVKKPFS